MLAGVTTETIKQNNVCNNQQIPDENSSTKSNSHHTEIHQTVLKSHFTSQTQVVIQHLRLINHAATFQKLIDHLTTTSERD